MILLIEDNEELNEINRRALEGEGYQVKTALTLSDARKQLLDIDPAVILLDVMMPDGDGIEFCDEIRAVTDAHILFLTAKTEHEDKIKGLEIGGDDYITKPYKLDEMLSRVRAVLRRRKIMDMKKTEQIRGLVLGELRLDYIKQRAYVGEIDLLLKTKEFNLMRILAERAGEYVKTQNLYELVWGDFEINDKNSLWVAMSGIRKRLAEANAKTEISIEHKRNEGYRLSFSNLSYN